MLLNNVISKDDQLLQGGAVRSGNEQVDEEDEAMENQLVVMDKELYQAAFRGQISFFIDNDHDHEYFLRNTSQGNNIIHIAVQQEKLEFVREATRRFPELICELNCHNSTPVHVAAKTGNLSIVKLLVSSCNEIIQQNKPMIVIPWRMENKEGNTPLHVALIHHQLPIARLLVQEDPELARFRNNLKQTPLHLAVKYNFRHDEKSLIAAMKVEVEVPGTFVSSKYKWCPRLLEEDSLAMIEMLLETNSSVACWCDTNGLTPLLQAAVVNPPYLTAISAILSHCPQSAEVCDTASGNTILHQIMILGFQSLLHDLTELFYKFPEVVALKDSQNFAGNTPSHLAMKNERCSNMILLMKFSVNPTIKNSEGVSVAELIQQNSNFKKQLKYTRKHDQSYTFHNGEDKSYQANWGEIQQAVHDGNLSFLREILEKSQRDLIQYSMIQGNILNDLLKDSYKYKIAGIDHHEVEDFVKQILKTLPFLICQMDNEDRNPLHVMAMDNPKIINESILELSKDCFQKLEKESGNQGIYSPPWRAVDIYGYTPLHVLLATSIPLYSVHKVGGFIKFDPTLGDYTDNNGSTALDLLCESPDTSEGIVVNDEVMKTIEIIVQKTSYHTLRRSDKDGMTPIMRASRSHCFAMVIPILKRIGSYIYIGSGQCLPNGQSYMHLIASKLVSEGKYKQLREFGGILHTAYFNRAFYHQDNEGNTPLHLAIEKGNLLFAKFCFENDIATQIRILRTHNVNRQTCLHLIANTTNTQGSSDNYDFQELVGEVEKLIIQVPDHEDRSYFYEALYCQDKDGNTALHLAIQKRNFRFAQLCIATTTAAGSSYRNIVEIQNNKNVSPGDLIGSAENLPYEFEQFLWSKPEVVGGMLGFRSLSGIPTTMIKDYVNTLGVTAALLATITFTAAFTVPGGVNSDNGFPILMRKAAFQVFMVSDIIAMCLSMMVLFFLLWIMTIGEKKQSVVLLDLTVFLLEAAFYATLLTFMTGLYVTTFPITPWIAILACVLCSLLILLMHKRFITGLIPGFIRMFVWSRKVYLSVGESIRKIVGISCCRTNQNKCTNEEGNNNSGQPPQSIEMQNQPQETANDQADSDAKALSVTSPSDAEESLIGSQPTSAHMITIDRSKQDDGASSSGVE